MVSNGGDGDDGYTGNDEIDQAEWDFCLKGGYDYYGEYEDPDEAKRRARAYRQKLKQLLNMASPEQRAALETALAQLKAGQELNWEAVARTLGKSSGAVKTQVRRVAAKAEKAEKATKPKRRR